MPEVGYDQKPVHFDLKTIEGGYVELRRLPYDELLARREMATRLSMEQAPRRSKGRKAAQEAQQRERVSIDLAQRITREYEFANCIVDHNLTVDGTPVNFAQPKMAFKIVDPRVLQEIELLLSDLNMEADEDELEDFTNAVTSSFSGELTSENGLPTSTLHSVIDGSE